MSILMAQCCGDVSESATPQFSDKTRSINAREILIRAFDALGDWQDRARERRQLMGMSDRGLHDLGLARTAIDAQATRPFWRN